jgi:ABC-type branched-subunit amino acid transport system substrate-binding protein
VNPGNTRPVTAQAAVWWFLTGDGGRSVAVHCDTGQEAGTVADIVTAVRASRRTRIVVVAPGHDVLETAVRLGEELGLDSRGLPQVGMGRTGAAHPSGVARLHASMPVRPPVVAVKSLTSALFGAPACDLMIVTGIHSASAGDAARNAARLMILSPHGDPGCPRET